MKHFLPSKSNLFFLCFLVLAAFTACSENSAPESPTLVIDASVTEEGKTLKPNDLIHVTGNGLQDGDRVDLGFSWDTGDKNFPVGSYHYFVPEEVARTSGSITVRMPYRFPAGQVEVAITRQGEYAKVGEVKVTDGQSPKDVRLYGVCNRTTGLVSQIVQLVGPDKVDPWPLSAQADFHSAVNVPLSYGLCGLSKADGILKPYFFDFFTGECKAIDNGEAAALCYSRRTVSALVKVAENGFSFYPLESRIPYSNFATRTLPVEKPLVYTLPDDLKGATLDAYPGIMTDDGRCVCSANKGNGEWALVSFDLRQQAVSVMVTAGCKALIPFFSYGPDSANGSQTVVRFCYAVVTNEGETRFYRFGKNMEGGFPGTQFATFAGEAVSITSHIQRPVSFMVHFVSTQDGKNVVGTYNEADGTWSNGVVSMIGDHNAIVLAN